jgi:hypothetical protein
MDISYFWNQTSYITDMIYELYKIDELCYHVCLTVPAWLAIIHEMESAQTEKYSFLRQVASPVLPSVRSCSNQF